MNDKSSHDIHVSILYNAHAAAASAYEAYMKVRALSLFITYIDHPNKSNLSAEVSAMKDRLWSIRRILINHYDQLKSTDTPALNSEKE